MMTNSGRNWPRIAGWLGLIGALVVGIGEYTIQFSLTGDYFSPGYEYFRGISSDRLFVGHYLSVLAAPLYILGYWHLYCHLRAASVVGATVFLLLGGYSFAVGAVWLGQRVFLALTVQAIDGGLPLNDMLETFASLNEPLINVLRLAVLINSVLWVWMIASGRSDYPKWLAVFSPIVMLVSVFAIYMVSADVGRFLLPGAMNVAHVILFGLSLFALSRQRGERSG